MKDLETNFINKINKLKKILIEEVSKSDRIFIVPHSKMDFDALASATILYTMCKLNRKDVYIVSNDKEDKMKQSIKLIYKELKEKCTFITTDEFDMLRTENELIILTDTNSEYLIPITNIDTCKNIMVIDHHNPDRSTVKTDKLFIDTEMSSASEILFYVMKSLDIYIDTYLAQLLLAGIYLDTSELHYIPTPFTLESVTKILKYGANLKEVQDLFVISDFEDDRKQESIINGIIDRTKFIRENDYTLAISLNNEDSETIYEHNHLAKAADRLLKYNFDADFVIGFIDRKELGTGHKDLVCVKARSKNTDIDVSEIMNVLGGGGDYNRASSIIETNDIEGVKELITLILGNEPLNIIIEKLHTLKEDNKTRVLSNVKISG